ncbi:Zn-ribbon domain-containing OB-fold protein [Natronobeatus ordinarius]|uniref:Zn-ribbon domain-containing OB-fold protein n=1 Tax=Natronobeatus ordinarius TaxID=2963433 RepID=UPI0020CDFD63|nr:OB-fold domain-containing protein [Natronobeatus ordinarius]
MNAARVDGYDDLLDAIVEGEGYYYRCPDGHATFPPARRCPDCGSAALERAPLPDRGTIVSHTTVHVAGPSFVDDAPYVTAVVSFGPIKLTGIVRGGAVAVGQEVAVDVGTTETTGERFVAFEPVEK